MNIAPTNGGIGKAPRAIICYVCGRQYGTSSFEIHLKQCKDLFLAREAQKDPHERKKLPPDPSISEALGTTKKKAADMTQEDIDKMNQLAQDNYSNNVMAQCEFCGRRFLPEKLPIHNKSCTRDNPAKRVDKKVESATPTRPDTASSGLNRPDLNVRPRTAGSSEATKSALSKISAASALAKTTGQNDISAAASLAGSPGSLGGGKLRNGVKFNDDVGNENSTSTGGGSDSIDVLNRRIDALEVAGASMLRTINELKEEVRQLKSAK